jgi:hypothetical protein
MVTRPPEGGGETAASIARGACRFPGLVRPIGMLLDPNSLHGMEGEMQRPATPRVHVALV